MSISRTIEMKFGKVWKPSKLIEVDTNPTTVYTALSEDLISKKLCGAAGIKSVKRTPLYNGFQKIVVTYSNNTRAIYTVKN